MTETETKWSERVREWKASGRTASEFAEGRDFKASTLAYWASRLRRVRAGATPRRERRPRVRMARVVRTAARPEASAARPEDSIVVTVGTARVAVRAGFDEALLRQVVKALGGER
jgi:hypothetical protein